MIRRKHPQSARRVPRSRWPALCVALLFLLAAFIRGAAAQDWRTLVAAGQLVELSKLDPTLRIELRYATTRNGAREPLYPSDFPALLRPEAATRLLAAQHYLREHGCVLKIWDAYRPPAAQRKLWSRAADHRFVADPDHGPGSMHCLGVAVDVTLVNAATGEELKMPTDFDVFTDDARAAYKGDTAEIAIDLYYLRHAMKLGGFLAQGREWWHFTARDWARFKPF